MKTFTPDVLLVYSHTFAPDDVLIKNQLGPSGQACGIHPAFIPAAVSGEQREAARLYTDFLVSHCPANLAQASASTEAQSVLEAPAQPDPHRPPCTGAECKKIKEFLKDHYCGESPFGNGPEDGCNYKDPVRGAKLTAGYFCEWNEAEAKSKCLQQGEPSTIARDLLLHELSRIGLPKGASTKVHFRVVQSDSGWSLMSADYDEPAGSFLMVCEVVVAVDPSQQTRVLRETKLQKQIPTCPKSTPGPHSTLQTWTAGP